MHTDTSANCTPTCILFFLVTESSEFQLSKCYPAAGCLPNTLMWCVPTNKPSSHRLQSRHGEKPSFNQSQDHTLEQRSAKFCKRSNRKYVWVVGHTVSAVLFDSVTVVQRQPQAIRKEMSMTVPIKLYLWMWNLSYGPFLHVRIFFPSYLKM